MKELAEMNFDEMVTFATWRLVEDVLRGIPFRQAVSSACQLALLWKDERGPNSPGE